MTTTTTTTTTTTITTNPAIFQDWEALTDSIILRFFKTVSPFIDIPGQGTIPIGLSKI